MMATGNSSCQKATGKNLTFIKFDSLEEEPSDETQRTGSVCMVNVDGVHANEKEIESHLTFVYIRGSENDMTDINKKSSMYTIERGVPTPCHPNRGKWATIVSKMNDGDSVVVTTYSEVNAMRQAIIRDGKKSVARELSDGRFRVWKLPKQ